MASLISTADDNATEPRTARITWGEWPPYHSKSMANQGLYTQVIRESYQAVGISVEFGIYPWKRALLLAHAPDSGWDGSSGWNKTAEREKEFFYADALHQGCVVFFHKFKTAFDWTRAETMRGLTIGVVSGYRPNSMIREMKNSGSGFIVDEISEEKFGIRMLNAGRIDAFVSHKGVGQTIINHELNEVDGKNITSHPRPLFCDSYHLLFSKQKLGSRFLVEQFNVGLKSLQDSGRYQEIMGET